MIAISDLRKAHEVLEKLILTILICACLYIGTTEGEGLVGGISNGPLQFSSACKIWP